MKLIFPKNIQCNHETYNVKYSLCAVLLAGDLKVIHCKEKNMTPHLRTWVIYSWKVCMFTQQLRNRISC